jgi:hypothetical protein
MIAHSMGFVQEYTVEFDSLFCDAGVAKYIATLSTLFQKRTRLINQHINILSQCSTIGERDKIILTLIIKNLEKLVKSTDQHHLALPNDLNQTKPVLYTPYKNLHPS